MTSTYKPLSGDECDEIIGLMTTLDDVIRSAHESGYELGLQAGLIDGVDQPMSAATFNHMEGSMP